MAENRKTTSKPISNSAKDLAGNARAARPVLRLKNRGGAPKGNRNAWKTGVHSAPIRDLFARIRAHRRKIAAVLSRMNDHAASP